VTDWETYYEEIAVRFLDGILVREMDPESFDDEVESLVSMLCSAHQRGKVECQDEILGALG
jgi:hypothetical protein